MPKLVTAQHSTAQHSTKLTPFFAPIALSLLLTACGSDDNSASTSLAPPPAPKAQAAPKAAAMPLAMSAQAQTSPAWTAGKPSIKELMDATGIDFHQASSTLYGIIGSNQDTRDWNAIMNTGTGNIIHAANDATAQMYAGYRMVTTMVDGRYTTFIIAGTGVLLTSGATASTAEEARSLSTQRFGELGFYNRDAQGQPVISNASGSGTTTIAISNDIDLSYQPPRPDPTPEPTNPPAPPPTATLSKTSDALEGNNLSFTVTLDAAANGITTANISYSAPNPLPSGTTAATGAASCTGTADYTNGTTSVDIPSGQTSATFTVPTCVNATNLQASSVTVTLSGISGNAQLSSAASNISKEAIIHNTTATGKLNDTGVLLYGTASTATTQSNSLEANDPNVDTPTQQDAAHGRDAQALAGTLAKVGSSSQNAGKNNGFDFTKISSTGQPLAADAISWDCVLDNHTGLMWENKTNDGGLRDKDHTYTWYNTDTTANDGFAGLESGGTCYQTGRCDTEKYVSDVNAAGLCGYTNWRMPNVEELYSILDFGKSDLLIDTTFFPTTNATIYATSLSYLVSDNSYGNAPYVSFYSGEFGDLPKNHLAVVRLVRGQ